MKKYKIGIIGYGGFGKFLHHWWDKLENAEVTAISDTNPVAIMRDGVMHYGNWEDLLDDPEIDIVSIATPPSLHIAIACAAMRKQKHVLLEKPVALTSKGAQEILRVQQETGMVLTVDHMLRYNPIIAALAEAGKQQIFGKLRHVAVSNYAQDEGLPEEHWFWDKSVSGGIFIEHGVHFFDIVNALTNQTVIDVSGFAHKRNSTQEDQVSATVLYNEGLIANHYHSFSGPGFFEQTTIRLTYDLARIEIEGWMPMKGSVTALVGEADTSKLNLFPGLKTESVTPVADLTDVSRPEGWGSSSGKAGKTIISGGIEYDVTSMVSANFEIRKTKSEVYGFCLQQIITDIIAKIEDRSHSLTITLEDALEALKIAEQADRSAAKIQDGTQ